MSLPRLSPNSRRSATVAACLGVLVVMGGLAASAKPLYDAFCRFTGAGGTTQRASKAPDGAYGREIEIRFDSNVAGGAPLTFRPDQRSMKLRVGENAIAYYHVKNTSDRPITAVATYNVTPHRVGLYFQKLECFCYQDRTLAPGEEAQLPVIFFVHKDIETERTTRDVSSITLSYTFFEKAGFEQAAVAASTAPQ